MAPAKKAPSKSVDLSTSTDAADLSLSLKPTELSTLITKLTEAFTLSFNSCVDRLITAMDQKINYRLDVHETESFDINKKIEKLEKENRALSAENITLKDSVTILSGKIDQLAKSCDDLDQYSRGSNMLIHGIPVITSTDSNGDSVTDADLVGRVIHLLNSNLGTSVSEHEINAVHRLPKATTGPGNAPNTKAAPIIVQFMNKKTRDSVLQKRKSLKGKGFSLSEQLTVTKANLLKKANEIVTAQKLKSAWSHDGKILVRTHNDRTIVINSGIDLDKFQ